MTDFDKITQLLQTLNPANIELGLALAEHSEPTFRAWFEDRVTELLTTDKEAVNYLLYELSTDDLGCPEAWENYKEMLAEVRDYTYNGISFSKSLIRHILTMDYGSIEYLNECTCNLKLPHCNYKNNCLPF